MSDFDPMTDGESDEEGAAREASPLPGSPRILSREEHSISRRNIDPDALKVMYRLNRFGYHAFVTFF
jgi:hypothetical protein